MTAASTTTDQPAHGPRVGYFGPATTHTHAAALLLYGPSAIYEPFPTIGLVFDAVATGLVDHGVVPIENSTEGTVRETVDCLINESPLIEREIETEIRHCLLGAPGLDPTRASAVISHPQALAQCRKWLDANYPKLPRRASASTAQAAREARESGQLLAIASSLAAETEGLTIFAKGINDRKDNTTRFVSVGAQDGAPTGADRTSLVFTTPHERGALRSVLGILDDSGVNLSRIESRPLPNRLWEYAFVVDVEGHRSDASVRAALAELERTSRLVKVLGSYPRGVVVKPPGS